MKREENFLEEFKRALVSTIKSISQKKDCFSQWDMTLTKSKMIKYKFN